MFPKKSLLLAAFLVTFFATVTGSGTWPFRHESRQNALTGKYIAFSLLEAQRQAKSGNPASPALAHLGGMTRLVGLVHDPETGDVILVGKVVEGRPQVNLDDLIVALRARLVSATWPLVSIDPTTETAKTGLQTVRFEGGIEDTRFGEQFLDCDILLKKYSLELLDCITGVESYKTLCETSIRSRLRVKGVTVRSAEWLSAQKAHRSIRKFYQRPIQAQESFLSRFWFRPLPLGVDEIEGVFVIRDLCLCVAKEVIERRENGLHSDSGAAVGDVAAGDFSRRFTEHFPKMASKYPGLKRLEMLYAMVAAAEAIARLEHRPDLHYFLYDYELPGLTTDKHYDLIELCGILRCSDGSDYLVKISGGIELRTLLTRLNGGDVDAMRQMVLGSRPSQRSLYWVLPLAHWRIPNEQYCQEQYETEKTTADWPPEIEEKKVGFSLHVEAFQLAPAGGKDIGPANLFVGFSSLRAAPPLATNALFGRLPGGVDMPIEPKGEKEDLRELKKGILQSKQPEDSLSWPVEVPKKE